MPRLPGLLLILLLAASTFAQDFDLSVTLDAPDTARPRETYTFRGSIHNAGPDTATDVIFHLATYSHSCYSGARLDPIPAGVTRTFECSVFVQPPPYVNQASAGVYAPGDRDSTNNSVFKLFTIITPPDLVIERPTSLPATAIPGLPFSLQISYRNVAAATATGVKLTITGPEILAAPPNCLVNGGTAVCDAGTLAPAGFGRVTVQFRAPDISEHTMDVAIEIAGNEADADPSSNRLIARPRTYRTFFVTSTADAGSGSLRAAIEGANATCNTVYPCLVAFRIQPAGATWQTIRVESPLPRVTAAQLQIDGSTQRAYVADTNPFGPEIELTGSANAGNGLDVATPCEASIHELAINGFPGAGLLLSGNLPCSTAPRSIRGNFIGTDPTGARAVPNGRGIVISVSEDTTPWLIVNNVISGNRRSGVFIETGPRTKISNNAIGLNAAVTAALGNGASGVYIARGGRATDVFDNYIGFNAHWGVAIARGAEYVALSGNSFQANHQQAIDYDLDGLASNQPIPIPEITGARVENGATIVEGLAPEPRNKRVSVYANDAPDPSGYGEGQYYLGIAFVDPATGRFTFRHPGDLRGKWIAATATEHIIITFPRTLGDENLSLTTTSELSRAVEVR